MAGGEEPVSSGLAHAARRLRALGFVLVATAVVALVAAFVCWSTIGWVYPVTSGSMEPTIRTGEHVFLRYSKRVPERFDIVAFQGAGGGASVKRVFGVPGDLILINSSGDVRINGRMLGIVEGRPPMVGIFDSRRQSIADHWRHGSSGFDPWIAGDGGPDEVWRLDASSIRRKRAAAGLLRFHDRVTDGALGPDGVYELGNHGVHDLAVEFDVRVVEPGGDLIVQITEQGDVFELRVRAPLGGPPGSTYIFRQSTDASWISDEKVRQSGRAPIGAGLARLVPDQWVTVRFANVDNWIVASVGGQETTVSYEQNAPRLDPLSGRPISPGERVRIGAEGLVLEIRKVRIERDFHVVPSGTYAIESELQLADDEVFVLGDSLDASRDSRARGPVNLDRLIGQVEAVVWPFSARRRLR